ncbi:MAG: rhodanese-like domain-containing protein [Candidatus Omnitrophica bacterium]|nr:rhodanese-like domain-containing protein [Candidatus Omnitrophota bacterium]
MSVMRVLGVAAIMGLIGMGACGAAEELPPRQEGAAYVTVAEVKAQLEAATPVTFLDVREADEFAAGHLEGARNISYDQVASITAELPNDQPIILYCIHSAHRAPEAAKTLAGLGFAKAVVLEGGIVAWQAGGQTIRANDLAAVPTILQKTDRCAVLGEANGVKTKVPQL